MEKPRATPEDAAILQANDAFYQAFNSGEHALMLRVWAEDCPVSCVHPGLPALLGRESVMESWRQILNPSARINMRCDRPRVHVLGESAIVTCYEANGEQPAHLAATNVFVRERDAWKLVHHHAGPLARPLPRRGPPPPRDDFN